MNAEIEFLTFTKKYKENFKYSSGVVESCLRTSIENETREETRVTTDITCATTTREIGAYNLETTNTYIIESIRVPVRTETEYIRNTRERKENIPLRYQVCIVMLHNADLMVKVQAFRLELCNASGLKSFTLQFTFPKYRRIAHCVPVLEIYYS